MKFKLPKDEYSGTYNLEIYAIDSFDNTSEPIKKEITIQLKYIFSEILFNFILLLDFIKIK